MLRVVAITVPFPGAKRPLEEGTKLGWWDLLLLEGQRDAVIPPADIYILGAWHPIYDQLLPVLPASAKVIDLWTSAIGEMDFTPIEQGYLQFLVKNPRIDSIWFGDPALAAVYSKGFHAVYPFAVDQFKTPTVVKTDTVTLFCPTGPKKNILNILYGVAIAQRYNDKISLRTNVTGYDFLLNHDGLLGADTMRFKWLKADEYQQLIAAARVNLAVSHAETYNYQVAEALMCGTGSVISPAVPQPGWSVDNPNSAEDIADAICNLWDCPDKTRDYQGMFWHDSQKRNRETFEKIQEEFVRLTNGG